ncbi:MAG: zinc-dependent alcohol dehydrogenase family protein [Verrucomicrobia bacterium]|nr:zinc-dependent alcohol dehydrogenase family protein [Verrucomicrobiota bacterium]MDA1045393.1 zinc-dependent alcohol dehydrogenase family protein [Verrucomicrobiota bacterium]
MKAIILHAHGGPELFRIEDRPKPEIKPGHVLIRVAASSVNPVDFKIRQGLIPIGPELPGILHGDMSGTVEEVGEGVEGFTEGDEVYGCIGGFKDLPGVLADYALADARLLARKPTNLSMIEAAALPLVTITAWNALMDRAQVSEGQRVLVHAAAGGVGHIALQIAKAAGAEVHVTASSEEKIALGRELGADVGINYKEATVEEYVAAHTNGEGYDVVFDTVGTTRLDDSFQAAKIGGTVVSIAARSTHDLTHVHVRALTLHVVFMLLPLARNIGREHHGAILRQATQLVEAGKLRPHLHTEVFPFERVGDAHALLESGGTFGKIVLSNS